MKSIVSAMATVSCSLEKAIEYVSNQSWGVVNAVGFSTLPDDVLAHIFELCKKSYGIENSRSSIDLSNRLTSVCGRFRRVALHLPCLWEDVCNTFLGKKYWFLELKRRCLNPVVFLPYYFEGADNDKADFLQSLHPPDQWGGLHFICEESEDDDAHRFFELVSSLSGGDFTRLEKLSLRIGWENEEWETRQREDEPTTNLLDSDAALISTWKLPSLAELTLMNLIPSYINCPNLQSCNIELLRYIDVFEWDLDALKGFFRSICLVESLSFTFKCAGSPIDYDDSGSNPVEFLRLMSLTMEVGLQTEPKFLRDVMIAIDVPVLSKLTLSLNPDEQDEDDPGFRDWLDAIFMSSSGKTCLLPSVETLILHVTAGCECDTPYDLILPAAPRVRDLRLGLPCYRPNLDWIFERFKDLRSVQLDSSNDPTRKRTSSMVEIFRRPERL